MKKLNIKIVIALSVIFSIIFNVLFAIFIPELYSEKFKMYMILWALMIIIGQIIQLYYIIKIINKGDD